MQIEHDGLTIVIDDGLLEQIKNKGENFQILKMSDSDEFVLKPLSLKDMQLEMVKLLKKDQTTIDHSVDNPFREIHKHIKPILTTDQWISLTDEDNDV